MWVELRRLRLGSKRGRSTGVSRELIDWSEMEDLERAEARRNAVIMTISWDHTG